MATDLTPMVVEFLLRRSPDDRVVNDLLQFLPLPKNNHPRLKKALLLRKIDSEISKGPISEKTLEFLELIEELDHQNGVSASDSLKLAYCAVAVECTFRCLDDGEKNFFFAVKRIWKARVSKMEGGLVSDELKFWRKEIEEAVWDSSVCENARLKSRKIDALGAVKSYVAEGWASLGPSLLELEFGRVDDDESLKEVLKLCNTIIQDQVGDKGVFLGGSCPDPTVDNASKDMDRDVVLPKRRSSSRPRRSRGAKITSQEEFDVGTSANNDVQQANEKNSMEPQTAPTDPPSGVFQMAEDVMTGTETGGVNGEGSVEGKSGVAFHPPNPCLVKSTEVGHGNEADFSHGNDVPKSSSVSQNVFVSIRKQDDCESRPHLGTKKQRLVTPVEKKSVTKYVRKRDIKRWSLEEEDTLRTGVQLYGMGQWKVILNAYRDVFEERTEVDLKDKWRNMTR